MYGIEVTTLYVGEYLKIPPNYFYRRIIISVYILLVMRQVVLLII